MNNKMIYNDRYYTVYGWMATRLNLKPNEQAVFALIYSYTKHSKYAFCRPVTYIMQATGLSLPTVVSTTKTLLNYKLIIDTHEENKYAKHSYMINTSEVEQRFKNTESTPYDNINFKLYHIYFTKMNLTATDAIVLALVSVLSNDSVDGTHILIDTFRKFTNTSRPSITRALNVLKDKNLISATYTYYQNQKKDLLTNAVYCVTHIFHSIKSKIAPVTLNQIKYYLMRSKHLIGRVCSDIAESFYYQYLRKHWQLKNGRLITNRNWVRILNLSLSCT